MEINESQETAIKHKDGPMLVLAGPGSGKTFVITNRTKHLIESYGVHPGEILVITFTKAAAEEMKERFLKLMHLTGTQTSFGTFHAIFFKILKYAYNYNASNIIKEEEKKRYYKEIIEGLELEIEDEKEFIEGVSGEISLVKGERMDIKNYYSMNCSEDVFSKIYHAYESRLRRANLIDFDDMLLLCYELLTERRDILSIWQNKYRYILIDEFQDVNRVQYDIIRLLALPENNLFIVGDDDQSIYRFRGAKPEIMLNFTRDYEGAAQVLLDKNYRSVKSIVDGAARVVSHNEKRFPKKIEAVKEEGKAIETAVFNDIAQQNDTILNTIINYHNSGMPYSDMAVLFRTNTQPRRLIEMLMEYNVPFKMRDVLQNIYEHWIVQDILSYIRLAMGSRDRGIFLKIINRPKRYVTRECFKEEEVDFEKIKVYYKDKSYVTERLEKLWYDLAMLKKLNPFAAINYIRRAIGYDGYLSEYAKLRRMKEEELFEVLSELLESAKEFNDYEAWFAHMEEYKEELRLQAEQAKQKDSDGVFLATFHASKGLEYKIVFIIDVNEGITPHRKALLTEDMEEERRMFYVAMTRAKDELYLYSLKERYGKELSVSRFIGELYDYKDAFIKGAKVEHKTYGIGSIEEIKDEKITVKFENHLLPKTFHYNFCIQNQLIKPWHT